MKKLFCDICNAEIDANDHSRHPLGEEIPVIPPEQIEVQTVVHPEEPSFDFSQPGALLGCLRVRAPKK